MKIYLAIEFGSNYLRIFQKNVGLICEEPTIMIVNSKKMECIEYGRNALNKCGKLGLNEEIVYPIKEGKIQDFNYAKNYLEHILESKFGFRRTLKNFKVILCTSCGLNGVDKANFKKLFYECGIGNIYLVPQLVCASHLINSPENSMHLIMDLGGGKTEIGIINNDKILNAFAIDLSGQILDLSIKENLKYDNKILIDNLTAEKIKISIGSLYSSDTSLIKIWAQDLETKLPKSYMISATEISDILTKYYEVLIDGIRAVIADSSIDISTYISKQGITIIGNNIVAGLDKYFKNKTRLKCNILESKGRTPVIGAISLFDSPEILKLYN